MQLSEKVFHVSKWLLDANFFGVFSSASAASSPLQVKTEVTKLWGTY
jgi:hypothetical protein